MENQGRLIKVIFLLMVTMTAGALVLLALEGKPIKPTGFSLTGQSILKPVSNALGTEAGIEPGRWQNFKICFVDNNGRLTQENGPTEELLTGYHFIISDGSDNHDGQIYATQLWSKQLSSGGPFSSDNRLQSIRICLIRPHGYANKSISTPHQANQLETLLKTLIKQCQMSDYKITWETN